MSAVQFVVDDFKKNLANGSIDLVNDTIKAALCTTFAPSYSAWAGSTAKSEGDIVIPTTRNGRRYRAQGGGTTDSSEPTWPTTDGGTVVDNDITWEEYGGEHADNEFFNDVSGNEVASGDGYTTGGASLGSKAVTKASSDPIATQWDAADTSWTLLTKTMRTAWLYVDGSTPGTDDYAISYILLDDTPANVSVSGVDFTLQWNADGILELGR
jgi:hypothetical protein